MSQPLKIKLAAYDVATGSATFYAPPDSLLADAILRGTLTHVTAHFEPVAASTAGGPACRVTADDCRAVRAQLAETQAERERLRDAFDEAQARASFEHAEADRTREVASAIVVERDDYARRLRATDKRLATVAASNDRLLAQLEQMRGALTNARHQRDAAETKIMLLTSAWPAVQSLATSLCGALQPLLRTVSNTDPEPLMRATAPAASEPPAAIATCSECGAMPGDAHDLECDGWPTAQGHTWDCARTGRAGQCAPGCKGAA